MYRNIFCFLCKRFYSSTKCRIFHNSKKFKLSAIVLYQKAQAAKHSSHVCKLHNVIINVMVYFVLIIIKNVLEKRHTNFVAKNNVV